MKGTSHTKYQPDRRIPGYVFVSLEGYIAFPINPCSPVLRYKNNNIF